MEENFLLVIEFYVGAFKIFSESGRFESGLSFINALPFGTNSDHFSFCNGATFGIDNGVAVDVDAIGLEIHESGNTIAATGGDNMDGGGHHREDGVEFVEGNGVLRHKMTLAETHTLALAFVFMGLGHRETQSCRYGGAWQHT